MKNGIPPKKPADFSEKLYAALTLLLMTRPLPELMVVNGIDLQFLMVAGLYCVAFGLVIYQSNRLVWVGLRDKLLLSLVFLTMLSIGWSTDVSGTLKSCVTLLGGTFFGIYLAMRYSLREQMQVLLWVLFTIAILSLIVIVAAPSMGIEAAGGKPVWVGVYDNKNGLGRYMTISAVLSWIMLQSSRRKWFLWGNFILAITLVLMTRSATSLLVVFGTISFLPIFRVWRWRNARALPGLLILGILFAGIVIFFLINQESTGLDWFFVALGRNPSHNTLQVRMALWNVVLEKAQQRPWLGFGYGNTAVYDTLDSVALSGSVWLPEQSHSGFLELFMQLGLVGLLSMLWHVVLGFHRGITLARMTKNTEALWVLAYLTILLLFNFTYSVYLGQLTVPWTIYVALTLSVCIQLTRMKTILRESTIMEPPGCYGEAR